MFPQTLWLSVDEMLLPRWQMMSGLMILNEIIQESMKDMCASCLLTPPAIE